MSSIPDQLKFGMYLPTTNVWDPSQIYSVKNIDPQLKDLLVRLYQNINNISLAVNLKDTAYYVEQEIINSHQFFTTVTSGGSSNQNYRQVYRKVINFGALPNTATTSVAHGISFDANYSITRVYGAATDPVGFTYLPLPYAHPTAANNIALDLDATNVNITTGSNRTAYTKCYIIVEFLKN